MKPLSQTKIAEFLSIIKKVHSIERLSIRFLHGQFAIENILVDVPELAIYQLVSASRYLIPRTVVARAPSRADWLFCQLDDDRFREELRISKTSFFAIADLIKDHHIFQSSPQKQQTELKIQMMVALERLGMHGTGASVGRIARLAGISEGSVTNFTNRFIVAILSLEKDALFWPKEDEKNEISQRIERLTGFPSCIGFVDGTLIRFEDKPTWNGEDFFSRKMMYSLTAMIVCDDRKLIRMCYTGWAGNAHDSRVYNNSPLAISKSSFFSGDEYLLADSAYSALSEIVPTYKKPVNGEVVGENAVFNYLHSNLRVRVEHCIGILKARFQSLKGLRVPIRNSRDVARASAWIRCCCVLHNLVINYSESNDDFLAQSSSISDYSEEEILHNDDGGPIVREPVFAGREKRERVKRAVLFAREQRQEQEEHQ